MTAIWILCRECEDYWCVQHETHVHDCECPPVEEWPFSPYVSSDSDDQSFGDWLFAGVTFLSLTFIVGMCLYSLELGRFVVSPW